MQIDFHPYQAPIKIECAFGTDGGQVVEPKVHHVDVYN